MSSDLFKTWAKKNHWDKRVKAVCKPCWELKYCPYGPLVEEFPIKEERDEKSCRIFGHDCPVFYVAEPLTETKELRRITRSIPRSIQFKVLLRENQVCSICKKPVSPDEIHFDHIIPWSKGGPTEESNIRLLCSECNQKRGNQFEREFLVSSFVEHVSEPYDISIIEVVLMAVGFGHNFFNEKKSLPKAQDFADEFNDGNSSAFEEFISDIYEELTDFFNNLKPKELKVYEYKFLKYRLGFIDGHIHTLKETCEMHNLDIDKGIELDKLLFARLGIYIETKKSDLKRWREY